MRIALGIALCLLTACAEGKGGHYGGGGGGWEHSSSSSSHESGGGGGWGHSSSSSSANGGRPTLAETSTAPHTPHLASNSGGQSTNAKIANAAANVAVGVAAAVLDNGNEAGETNANGPDTSPLIDNHDPCNYCPEDMACGQCLGFDEQTCQYAPAGAYSRCASPGM